MIRSVVVLTFLALPAAFAAQTESAQSEGGGTAVPDGKAARPVAAEPVPEQAPAPAPEVAPAPVTPKPPPPKEEDTTIDRYRTPFEVLAESTIGVASRSVLFDWRKATVGFGVVTSALLELNNFYSMRVGGFVRIPTGNLTAELAVTRVITWGSDSSEKLSLTPYRQSGRPSRIEFDINLAYALLEGVGTPRLGLIPTAELVFSVNVGFRYLYYPGALGTANAGQVLEAIFAPKLQEREIVYLERERLPGMQIDRGRYGLMAGFSLDLYFRTGIFLEPKVMLGLPVLSGMTNSSLGWWWELSMSLGWAL